METNTIKTAIKFKGNQIDTAVLPKNRFFRFIILLVISICSIHGKTFAQDLKKVSIDDKKWISRSNSFTDLLLDLDKKYNPEFGSDEGIAKYDTLITVPTLANVRAERKEEEGVLQIFKTAVQQENDPHVKQDLQILISRMELDFREDDYSDQKKVEFLNPTAFIFSGLQTLLDEQTATGRRSAAVIRLRKYAGLTKGFNSLTAIYQDRTARLLSKPGLTFPSKQEIELALSRNSSIVDGMADLFKKYHLQGWESTFSILRNQLVSYDAWIRNNMLPRARTDYKLPTEEYQFALEDYGVSIPPKELAALAHLAFTDIQAQMVTLAAQVAKKYNLPSSDYRDVISYLKKGQLHGDSILMVYREHLGDIEKIIVKNHLVSMPERQPAIRLASAAETSTSPAPHMVPPPFLNNTGQHGVFILPLNLPVPPGGKADNYDDYTYEAATWTMIAHEVRPGHELQFDKMIEEGVSKARALYAFNSTNAEGWALYSEYLIEPYMPLDAQLISLDFRLLRAARAFCDPELQSGLMTQQQVLGLLMKDVVLSHANAEQEVQRYSVRSPGQADSYFYGFNSMLKLRKDVEQLIGSKFNLQQFHDFILSQGLLPPALLRNAVMDHFSSK